MSMSLCSLTSNPSCCSFYPTFLIAPNLSVFHHGSLFIFPVHSSFSVRLCLSPHSGIPGWLDFLPVAHGSNSSIPIPLCLKCLTIVAPHLLPTFLFAHLHLPGDPTLNFYFLPLLLSQLILPLLQSLSKPLPHSLHCHLLSLLSSPQCFSLSLPLFPLTPSPSHSEGMGSKMPVSFYLKTVKSD